MNIKLKNKLKKILSSVMAAGMVMSLIPSVSFAAQSNEYVDPADVWIEANGRTSEFDINATVTTGTLFCPICDMPTTNISYRVPEYTRTGETALNRGVYYSDGTCSDGVSKGNLDDGTPGVDAFYTGYHWTKSVCQNCGTINSADGINAYSCGKDVYSLNPCDSNFFIDFDNTSYTPYNSKMHTTDAKKGKYCQFCKGTYTRTTSKQENHNFTEIIDGELGNQRFHITADCNECGYKKNEYAAAKSVVQSYYGKVDGKAHTVTVSDLSENGVHTSIHYGVEANKCNKTSAPSYTEEGYYPVYYEIDYSYGSESMMENGVSYVWLLSDTPTSNTNGVHSHDYRYLETVRPTCIELGYDRFQCSECGALQKTNYTPSTGHDYNTVVIREASCQQGGLELHACKSCGSYYTENTSMTDHKYQTNVVAATCTVNGYTEHICINCGFKYISDLTPIAKHDYRPTITAPTCKSKGFTTYKCRNCNDTYISDYTEPSGHQWDEGHIITNSTCESDGVMEYDCKQCDEKMIKAVSANGHTPGAAATCTQPQICENCNAILELPKGHSYSETVTKPTCTTMGYTTYSCENCDNSYIGNYTDKTSHNYKSTVTAPTCTTMGYTTYTCVDCKDSYVSDYTDKLAHNYIADVTAPTCTTMGYTTYTCADCGENYVSDYTEVLPHNYSKKTVEPTCTSQGYTIYTCSDCGKEYIGDEQQPTKHNYIADVTAPTCTELGYTTYTCKNCGETHKSDYIEATGHKLSDWIIDTPATIEQNGKKHIECVICGTVINTVEIPKLPNNDNSDEDGHSRVGDYNILITDKNNKPIFNSEISIDTNDNLTIKLPDGRLLSAEDMTTITVTYTETQQPAENLNIFISDTMNNAATGRTDANGQLSVPNTNSSTGNTNGTVADNDKTYVVIVTDKNGELIPNCDVTVGDNYSIDVKLPANTAFNKDNRVTITVVTEKGKAVSGLGVQVIGDNNIIESGYTNINGQLTLPISNTDITDPNGYAQVIEGEKIYNVIVEDTKAKIENAIVKIKDGKISVTLPDGQILDTSNQTTVTVSDKDAQPVKDMSVTVTDKNAKTATKITDANGKITVPVKTSTGGGGSSSGGSGGGGRYVKPTYTVKVVDKDGKTVNVNKTIKDNKITLTLPNGNTLDDNYYTITVTDNKGKVAPNIDVTLQDKTNSVNGKTDTNGQVIMPLSEHKAYIVGYPDGTFLPDGNMTRAEAAAIFARNIADRKGENISNGKSSFTDVNTKLWYNNLIAYLEKYNIISGYTDGTFRPEEQITRAEFVTMCMRFYDMFDDITVSDKNIFNDVPKSHWAAGYIYNAIAMKWIEGYADGTFKPDSNITRAEVVAIVNRVLDHTADTEYVNKNISAVNKFMDLKDKSYWAFYEILEAANTHIAVQSANGETWVK
ncbi:MAG: S-layer homology domain-containing protein [Clostridia bacterium]